MTARAIVSTAFVLAFVACAEKPDNVDAASFPDTGDPAVDTGEPDDTGPPTESGDTGLPVDTGPPAPLECTPASGTVTTDDAMRSYTLAATDRSGTVWLGGGDLTGDGMTDAVFSDADHAVEGDRPADTDTGGVDEREQVGALWIVEGSALTDGPLADVARTELQGDGFDDRLGAGFVAEDLDLDGRRDLAVVAPGAEDYAGAVYLLKGPIPAGVAKASDLAANVLVSDPGGDALIRNSPG